MPELAELRLTVDYINETAKGKSFKNPKRNPIHKWKPMIIPREDYAITAQSRGKELILYMDQFPIRMSMGMSGHFRMTETGKEHKHSHLIFEAYDGTSLSFVDVRRFGKWWPNRYWSENRGPDPTTEFGQFCDNLRDNLGKRAFDKPICEVLMNQEYFNGIGNYLRAEIIYRISDLNPFMPARMALSLYFNDITELCYKIPLEAYLNGGGSIKDWDNPFGVKASTDKFMKCYGNPKMAKEKDRNGRMMWYHPKFKLDAKEMA